MKKIILWVGAMLSFCSVTEAKTMVQWVAMDLPPIFVVQGEFKDQGIVDEQIKIYMRELSGFEHTKLQASPQRVSELIVRDKTGLYCSGAFLPLPGTSSPKDFYMSEPVHIVPPNVLLVRADIASSLKRTKGRVSLSEILKEKKYKIAFIPGRPYGGAVNALLDQHKDSKQLYPVAHAGQDAVLKMVDSNRVDMALGYSMEANFYKKSGALKTLIQGVPLAENPENYGYFVACNKHPEGKKVIDQVNRVLQSLRTKPEFCKGYSVWYDEADLTEFKRTNNIH